MATEAQKHFRKEVKELLKERKRIHYSNSRSDSNGSKKVNISSNSISNISNISNIKYNSFNKKIDFIRKRLITFLGIVIIVFLSVYFFSILINIFNQVTSNKEKPIIVYIEQILSYDNQLVKINQSVNNYTNKLDMKSNTSRKKFVDSMNMNLNSVKDILNKITSINAPQELGDYKNNTIKRYENFYNGISFYILGVSKNERQNLIKAQQAFLKFNNDNVNRNANLINVFKRFKIEFQIQKDGSIRFWYKI